MTTANAQPGTGFIGTTISAPSSFGVMAFDANPPTRQEPGKPVTEGRQVFSVEAMTMGLYASASRILQNPDLAYRIQRTYQRQMRNDPCIDSNLEARMLAVRSLGWTIEPEDPEDPIQRARAAALDKAIRRIPRFNQALRWMLMSVWYGHSAVNFAYQRLARPVTTPVLEKPDDPDSEPTGEEQVVIAPTKWLPLHPDSVEFRTDGAVAVKVNQTRLSDPSQYEIVQSPTSGPSVLLNPAQRAATVVTISAAEAPDWFDQFETALPYSGRGLRSALIQYWMVKQATLQAAVRFTERLSGGLSVGKYPSGNDEARDAMRQVLNNLLVDANILMPVPGGMDEHQWGVEFPGPDGASGWETFDRMLGRMEGAIKERIIGQELTSGTASTGMGSGVAEAHERTFARIVKDDALSLSDDLSDQLVATMVMANWPDETARYRFAVQVDDENLDELMKFAEAYTRMGGTLDADELRRRAGLRAPRAGGEVLGGPEPLDPLGGLDAADLLAEADAESRRGPRGPDDE